MVGEDMHFAVRFAEVACLAEPGMGVRLRGAAG